MKSNLILVHFFTGVLSLSLVTCKSQSTGDYRSNAALMDWNAPADWQTWDASTSSWIKAVTIPDANQELITIQKGHTVVITNAQEIDQVIVSGTLKITNASLTINNGPGDDLVISAGGKLISEGSNSLIANLGTLVMNDSIINQANCIFRNTGTLVNSYACFKNKGTLINEAGSVVINTGDFLTGGSISFEKGSRYQHNFPSSQPTAGTIPTASWNNGSTCEIRACGNAFQPGALNQVFHHFIWNNSTQPHDFNLIANPNIITGNFEIKNTNGKKLAYKGSAVGDLAIADSFKLTNGTFVLTNGSASTLVTTSTYCQQGGTLDMSSSIVASTIRVSASFTHTGGMLQVSGTSASNSIVLFGSSPSTIESTGFRAGDLLTFKINKEGGTGTCSIPPGKSFILNSNTSFSLTDNTSLASDLQIAGTFLAKTNTWDLSQGNTQVTGNFVNQCTLPIRTNSSTATLQFNAGSFYIQDCDGGEVATAAWSDASTLHVQGIALAAVLENGGQTFGTILWDCKDQQQSCIFGSPGFEVLGNFTIEFTGKETLRFPDCDFKIGGDLTLRNDAQLQLAAAEALYNPVQRNIDIHGTVSVLKNASIQVGNPNSSVTPTFSTDQYRTYNLQLKKDFIYTSTVPLTSYHHKSYQGMANDEAYLLCLTFNGNKVQHLIMKKQASDLIALSETEYLSTNVYQLMVSGTGTHLVPQLDDLTVHHLQVDASDTLTIGLEDINILQYPTRNFDGASAPSSCNINGVLDVGMNALSDGNTNGSFFLHAGATLLTKHPQGIDATVLAGSIQNTGNRLFDPAAHYVYNGNMKQVSGTGLPASVSGSLTIDNSALLISGGMELTKNTEIDGTLYLKRGKLLSSASAMLTIGTKGGVIPAGGQALSFVEGPVKKITLSAGSEFLFPTGSKTRWARIGITPASSSTAEFTAAYVAENPNLISNSLFNLDHISTKEYWKLDQTNNNEAVNIKLFWESGNYSGIYSTNAADLKLAQDDSPQIPTGKWKAAEDNLLITGEPTSGSIQAALHLSDLNLFTFGSATSVNPLPVKLLSFTGSSVPKGNLLSWTTASEQNTCCYGVQRSSNGSQFSQIGIVKAHGNSNNLQSYSYADSLVNTPTFYYRLKQIDTDGKFTYSSIIRIEGTNQEVQEVIVYPNPATTTDIHIITSGDVQSFRIYNILGKSVFEAHPTAENSEYVFTPDSEGIYFIQSITLDGKVFTKRLIKS